MTPATQIDGLEIKLRQLAAQVDRQRAQYEAVVADNQQLQRELDHQVGVVNALQDKLERNQSGTAPTTPVAAQTIAVSGEAGVDTTAYRQTIAFCLGEIDRCLDWLHRN